MRTRKQRWTAGGEVPGERTPPANRRNFFKLTGGAALLAAVAGAGCRGAGNEPGNPGWQGLNLGSGDVGVMNYLYLLESLAAAYYNQVLEHPYPEINPPEQAILTQARDHVVVHVEFCKRFLASHAIPPQQFNFQIVEFTSRDNVLHTALQLENVTVGGYNGAGKRFESPDVLELAQKMASARARQAVVISNMVAPNGKEFAEGAMDPAWSPSHALKVVRPYLGVQVRIAGWMW
jgi:hypothetical protein